VEQVLQDANIIIDSIHPEDLPTYTAPPFAPVPKP